MRAVGATDEDGVSLIELGGTYRMRIVIILSLLRVTE